MNLSQSGPVLEGFWAWVEETSAKYTANESLKKALIYTTNQRRYLETFLEDGRIPISNNDCETCIRLFTNGSKAWLFADSPIGKKYFTERIIEILKRYQLSATFNLNAGLFGEKGLMGRVGNYGIKYVKEVPKSLWMKYCYCNRIPEDEVRQVYQGFEIASHAYRHENLKELDANMLEEAIGRDIQKLQDTKL